jgi:hypothetical protein
VQKHDLSALKVLVRRFLLDSPFKEWGKAGAQDGDEDRSKPLALDITRLVLVFQNSQHEPLMIGTASPPRFRPIVPGLYGFTALAPLWSRSLLQGALASLGAFAFDTFPAMTYCKRESARLEMAQDFS